MIYLSLALLLLGVILLCIEAFIPGFGITGISGIIIIAISSVITAFSVPFGPLIVIGEIILLSAAIFFLLHFFRKKQLYGKLILNDTLNLEEKEIGNLDYFVGKEGMTKTSLRPFGTVDFNGVTVEASSDGQYIGERKSVVVTEVRRQTIMVKPLEREQ